MRLKAGKLFAKIIENTNKLVASKEETQCLLR